MDAPLGIDVGLQGRLVAAAADAQGYAVDLAGNQPPAWMQGRRGEATTRFLETANLRRSVRSRVRSSNPASTRRRSGSARTACSPTSGGCWCSSAAQWVEVRRAAPVHARGSWRRAPSSSSGLEAIHFAIERQGVQRAPARLHWDYSRRDAEQIAHLPGRALVGRRGGSDARVRRRKLGDARRERERVPHRAARAPGERLALGQLVGLRPADGKSFILSEVRWLMSTASTASLHGRRVGAARPRRAVAVRAASMANNAQEKYVQAFAAGRTSGAGQPRPPCHGVGLVQGPSARSKWRRTSRSGRSSARGRRARHRLRAVANFEVLPDWLRPSRDEPRHAPRGKHRAEHGCPSRARSSPPGCAWWRVSTCLTMASPRPVPPGLARAAAVDAIEALGEPRDVARLDADAGVVHARTRRAPSSSAPASVTRAALRRVAHGVRHQVGERAAQLLRRCRAGGSRR